MTAKAVTISLIIFALVYLFIFGFGMVYVYRLLRAGPVGDEPVLPTNPKRPMALSGGSPLGEVVQREGWL